MGTDGKRITDKATRQRIAGIVIPPAWTDVWICPSSYGHLQATGRDARGRKQYRYHPKYREVREQTKYDRMLVFGETLPAIRKKVTEDLAQSGLTRERILAAVVALHLGNRPATCRKYYIHPAVFECYSTNTVPAVFAASEADAAAQEAALLKLVTAAAVAA
jgi:DNA topoisomerase IB